MPSNTSLKGVGTTTRAIRIAKSVDRILEAEARKRNISINGLISSVLTKFAEWDRHTEDLRMVTLPMEIVRGLTQQTSEDAVAKAGAELGPELLTSEVIFWYEKVTLETFLEWLTLISKYNNLFSTQITKTDGDYVIVARHDLGKKGSLFMKNYFESGLKARLGIVPSIEMSEFQVSFRLRNV